MPPRWRRFFGVERDGQEIAAARLHHGIHTGLNYARLLPALVPLFEEMEAMRFSGYTERQWRSLEPDERAFAVAHFRLHHLIELHKEDAVAQHVKAQEEKVNGH